MEIDAVVTWVNSTDPQWVRSYEETIGEPFKKSIRFTGENTDPETELKVCLKLLKKHMPWLRNTFVLTKDGQVPSCLTDEIVVHHSAVGLGPVFNSLAIESCLHKIPMLSEKFVYFNDDIFVIKPLQSNQLFDDEDKPIVRLQQLNFTSEWIRSLDDTADIVGGKWNKGTTLPHVPYVLTKTIMERAEARLGHHWTRTMKCPLRYRCKEITPVFAATLIALQDKTAVQKDFDPIRYTWMDTITSQNEVEYHRTLGRNVICLGHYTGSYDILEEAMCGTSPFHLSYLVYLIIFAFILFILYKVIRKYSNIRANI